MGWERNNKVIPCSEKVEPGYFFGRGGGRIRAEKRFRVGLDFDITMMIKPGVGGFNRHKQPTLPWRPSKAWQVQHPRRPSELLRLHEGGGDRGESRRDDG